MSIETIEADLRPPQFAPWRSMQAWEQIVAFRLDRIPRVSLERILESLRKAHDEWDAASFHTRYRDAALDTIVQPADVLVAVAATLRNRTNLLIFGPVGVGKTQLGYSLLREYCFERRHDRRHPRLISALDIGTIGPEQLIKPGVLIIDDLGVERDVPTNEEALFRVVDGRWECDRQTVVSTNLTPEDFMSRVGTRVADRLLANGAQTVVLTGPSRRLVPLPEPVPDDSDPTAWASELAKFIAETADPDDLWRRWLTACFGRGLFEALVCDDSGDYYFARDWQTSGYVEALVEVFGANWLERFESAFRKRQARVNGATP